MRVCRIGICSVLLVLFMTLSRPAAAEGNKTNFVGGAGFGVTELSFDEKLDADTSFNVYQLFGSVARGNAYASITWADTLSDAEISEEDETGEASRQDLDLTLGYRLTDAWTVFAGYKDGRTDLNLRVRDSDIRQNERYAEDGVFAGVSYTLNLEKLAGTINFSLAYVRLDTDLKFTRGLEGDEEDEEEEEEEEEDEPLEFDDLEGRSSGDADGFSAGVSWVIPVGRSLAVRAGYKINQYNLDVKSQGMRFKPDQRLSYFDVGLLYAF